MGAWAKAAALIAALPAAITPSWQVGATHVDGVPASVLQAAAAVKIAVVDTGADLAAPDLAAKTPETWNTRTGSTDVRDPNGHGTFVASLAAGFGAAQLLVVKSASDGGSFTDLDEAAGITYAVDHGARILNLSLGGPKTSTTERAAVRYAVEHGVLVVASVGNDYNEHNPVEYPAALLQPVGSNGVGGAGLAVTASGPDGDRASYANTGSWISLAAPGEHVLGAVSSLSPPLLYPRAKLARNGVYGYASGTSFAAPQVAGAAALVWAANPSLTAQGVAQILKETASGGGHWTPELGFGVIDVAAAVARAETGASGILLGGRRNGLRATLNWSGTGARYTLFMNGAVLRGGTATTATVQLVRGGKYSFFVSALDANGATTARSATVRFVVP